MAERRRDHDLSRFSSSSDLPHGKDFLPNTMPGFQHPSGSPVFNAATQKIPFSIVVILRQLMPHNGYPLSSLQAGITVVVQIRPVNHSGNDHHRLLNLFLWEMFKEMLALTKIQRTPMNMDVCRRFSQRISFDFTIRTFSVRCQTDPRVYSVDS